MTLNKTMRTILDIGFCLFVLGLQATFKNISVILRRLVLLVEEAEYLERNTDLGHIFDNPYRVQ